MKQCPYCAEEIQDAAVKCKHCNTLLTAGTQQSAPDDTVRGDTLDYPHTVSADAIVPGHILAGRYRVLERLGSGGMGHVWRACDNELGIDVAVKVLPPILARNARSIAALRREATIALRLLHPSICRLHDFHSDGDIKFLVMEYIDGRTLEEALALRPDNKMTWQELLPVARQVASALDYAHGLSPPVLHRDIKPANIMVTAGGTAKLVDFGIAREIRESLTRVTGQQDTSGTLPYMSPEQFRGERLDARSDTYSFCTVLYEALAGVPFVSPGGSLAWQVLEKRFEPLPGAPDEANRILTAGLAKDRDQRPVRIFPLEVAPPTDAAPPPAPPTPAAAPAERPGPEGKVEGEAERWRKLFHYGSVDARPFQHGRNVAAACVLGALQAIPVIGWLAWPLTSLIVLMLLRVELHRHRVLRAMSGALRRDRFTSGEGMEVGHRLREVPGLRVFAHVLPMVLIILAGIIYVPVVFEEFSRYEQEEALIAGAFIGGGLALIYVVWQSLLFQADLSRHRRLEAGALAYAVGTLSRYDDVMAEPLAQWRRPELIFWNVLLVLLWPVTFPFVMAYQLHRHYAWEKSSGIAEVLA